MNAPAITLITIAGIMVACVCVIAGALAYRYRTAAVVLVALATGVVGSLPFILAGGN